MEMMTKVDGEQHLVVQAAGGVSSEAMIQPLAISSSERASIARSGESNYKKLGSRIGGELTSERYPTTKSWGR